MSPFRDLLSQNQACRSLIGALIFMPCVLVAQSKPVPDTGWTEILPWLYQEQRVSAAEPDYLLTGLFGKEIVRDAIQMQIRLLSQSADDPVLAEKLAAYQAALVALDRRLISTKTYSYPSNRPSWAMTCAPKTIRRSSSGSSNLSTSYYSAPSCENGEGLEYTSDAGFSHDNQGCKDDITSIPMEDRNQDGVWDDLCVGVTGEIFQSFKMPDPAGQGTCYNCPDPSLIGPPAMYEEECTTGSDAIRIYRAGEYECCEDSECGFGSSCLYGRCKECLEDADCIAPETCTDGFCAESLSCDSTCNGRTCSGSWDCGNEDCPTGSCFMGECLCVR